MSTAPALSILDKNPQTRQSNMELLRIIAMSMILIIHFLNHAIYRDETDNIIVQTIYPFFLCGVNLFFLISGYFRIKLSFSAIFKIIIILFIFQSISYLILICCGVVPTEKSILSLLLFPITKSKYWFIKAYVGLMIIAPVLNHGIETISQKKYRYFMLVFTFFTLYSCGIGQNMCNTNGYSFGQAVYLYCCASWIRREGETLKKISRFYFLLSFFIITLLSSFTIYFTRIPILFHYNSIFCLGASLTLFIYFTQIHFHNRLINIIATAALGCYLLQDGPLGSIVYPWQYEISNSNESLFRRIILFIMTFFAFWSISFIITKLSNKAVTFIFKYLPKGISEII